MLSVTDLTTLKGGDCIEYTLIAIELERLQSENPETNFTPLLDLMVTVLMREEEHVEMARDQAYDEGYSEGHFEGEVSKDWEVVMARDEGYQEGYESGFEDGYEKGKMEAEED